MEGLIYLGLMLLVYVLVAIAAVTTDFTPAGREKALLKHRNATVSKEP